MNLITTTTNKGRGRKSSAEESPALGPEQIRDWLVQRLAQMLQVDPADINTEVPFADYGLGSVSGVRMAGDLEALVGREVPPTLTWDYPTIEQVVQFLSSNEAT